MDRDEAKKFVEQWVYASARGQKTDLKLLNPWWPGILHMVGSEVAIVDFRLVNQIPPVGHDVVLFEHLHTNPEPIES